MQAPQRRAIATAAAAGLLAVLAGAGGVEASIPRTEASAELAAWPPALPDAPALVDLALAPATAPAATSATTTAPPAAAAAGDRFRLLDADTLDRLVWTGRPRQAHAFAELETRLGGIGLLAWAQHQEIQWLSCGTVVGEGVGPNLYQYGLNNPINFMDPLGLCNGEPGDPEECVSWWPYFPPGVIVQAQTNAEAWANNPDIGALDRAGWKAQALLLGFGADLEEVGRSLANLPHHKYSEYKRQKAQRQRIAELMAELGCGRACTGEKASQLWAAMEAEGLMDVAGPGIAEIPIGPGRFRPRVPRAVPRIHMGKQGKHIPGHNNYLPGRSILREDPASLAEFAGTGQQIGKVKVGLAGSRERVDFGRVIGEYVKDGVATPSSCSKDHARGELSEFPGRGLRV